MIRRGLAAFCERQTEDGGAPRPEKSGYVLHTTAHPGVCIAETVAVLDRDGEEVTVSLVQIFRLRDGRISRLRDCFAPQRGRPLTPGVPLGSAHPLRGGRGSGHI
ncbi:hypothetical protein ACWDUC_24745 [Streptomyces tricolor]|uniref:hypothetical protein n=1 Tax=Streptomyces sp. FBKL.4005 TaxID=2015515 RepID=UPI000B97BC95|nr:hypothetical protein [Streptomyces sp. FBKL.4005]OYP19784.1 hypothetical protein CFC35_39385 [Streptomyces sp. FBKL.4005]